MDEKVEIGEIVIIEETGDGVILELVEIEVFVREGKPIPKARKYKFRVDKTLYETEKEELTGREVLAFAGKTPDQWKLYLHKPKHQPELVAPGQVVNLRCHGIERFTTMPKDTTEGRGVICRQFRLPADDEAYLDGLGLGWETVTDGSRWLVISGWKLPVGYNQSLVRIALLIPPSYPDGQIDMVYVSPALARTDGKPIRALAGQIIAGENWQRWSRHRTGSKPWRPGVDDVASHLSLVDDWFRREFEA